MNPNDERAGHVPEPGSPAQVRKPSWKYTLRTAARRYIEHQNIDVAAGLTFYAVLSVFPGLLVLASALGLLGQRGEATATILKLVDEVAPADVVKQVREPLQQIMHASSAGVTLTIGLVLGIWLSSRYVTAFSRGMNRVHEVDEGRPYYTLKPIQLLITLALVALVVVMVLLLVVSGPVAKTLGEQWGVGPTLLVVWSIAKWPLLAAAAVLAIAILYYFTPNVKQPKFRWISLGALIALIVILLASAGFAVYIANFSNYDRFYGSLAGVIVFLLWLWIVNLILMFGAEFDAELERARELQAGIPAEEHIQLPLRDRRRAEKRARQRAEDVERGRALREQRGGERRG